jgi:hypothetical protein
MTRSRRTCTISPPRADQSYHALTTMLDGTQPCRHPDVDHYGPAISVDAINSFGVSAGHIASFDVVPRT